MDLTGFMFFILEQSYMLLVYSRRSVDNRTTSWLCIVGSSCPEPQGRWYAHAQIAHMLESLAGGNQMGSDSKNPPKARHRFSFSGPTKQPKVSITIHPPAAPTPVSNDDILDSMTKHTRPQDSPQDQAPQFENADETVARRVHHRGSARGALAVFLGGFVSVWLYGYVTKAYDIPYLSGVTQSPEVQTSIQQASSHPLILGAVTGTVLLGALGAFYLRHRRKN